MSEQAILSRDDLLRPVERRYKVIGPLPVRGGYARIQSLTEREYSEYELTNYVDLREKGKVNRARMADQTRRYLAMVLVDAAGNKLLSPVDVPKLQDWDMADINFVYEESVKHVNAKRNQDDLEKNFETTPAGN